MLGSDQLRMRENFWYSHFRSKLRNLLEMLRFLFDILLSYIVVELSQLLEMT